MIYAFAVSQASTRDLGYSSVANQTGPLLE